MKLSNLFYACLAVIFIASCSSEKAAKTTDKKKKVQYALAPDFIFDGDSIEKALNAASNAQKSESRRLFMNGLDLLANRENPAASIEFFREAICYYPDEKNYTHLFQAYLKNGEIEMADSVNKSLYGRLDITETGFNNALTAAARKDTGACIESLQEILSQGFIYKDKITGEKLFKFLEGNTSYESMLVSNFNDDEKLKKKIFMAFLKSVPDIELPFEINSDSARSFIFVKYINYQFAMFVPGMEDARFSRDVSNEYMYVGKFKTQGGMAFVYKSYQVIADTLNPVETNIVLYDTVGKIISTQEIGCFCSPLESKSFVINKDLSIDVKVFNNKWESDPLEKGYAGNK